MAITKTDICNKALTLVGAAPITNIDDDTNNARVLSNVYETALRSVLAECKWNFATKRILLSVSTFAPEWSHTGESYSYQRPADLIRIFETNDKNAIWREEGEYIFSDTSGLGIKYVYFLDNPGKYPSYFVDAFVDRLCADIAYMIVNSSTLGDKYKNLYESVSLPKAESMNSQTGVQQTIQDDAWENAKYGDMNPAA